MVYLIKRRAETSREELITLVCHPCEALSTEIWETEGRINQRRTTMSRLYSIRATVRYTRDGAAQLWYDAPSDALPNERRRAYDTFQQVVEPYWPWATREYVVIDGALPLKPPT